MGLSGRSTRFRRSRLVQGSSRAKPPRSIATAVPYVQPFRKKPCAELDKPEQPRLHENGNTRRKFIKRGDTNIFAARGDIALLWLILRVLGQAKQAS
jgi:hypothetical protein